MARFVKNTFLKPAAKSLLGFVQPVKTAKRLSSHGGDMMRAFSQGNQKKMAVSSMKFLGTATGVTYGVRAIRGRSIFRDKKGQRDILPWVPFV
jgi:hypothetical protein